MAWPKSFKDKKSIKELIKAAIRKKDEDIQEDEENFEEAIQNVNNVLTESKIPSRIQSIIEDPRCEHPTRTEQNSRFWILVRALKEFISQEGLLPLRGSLPDMFSDSKRYIELQNIYKDKANLDVETFTTYVKEILQDLQLQDCEISSEEIKMFCKNSHFLNVSRGLSIHDEVKTEVSGRKLAETIEPLLDMGADVYLIVRAVNRFVMENSRYPGEQNANELEDVAKLKVLGEEIKKECGIKESVSWNLFHEICRCNSRELHAYSAVMGGIAAQEIIKIITGQFISVDNTFLYNGINQTTVSLKLA